MEKKETAVQWLIKELRKPQSDKYIVEITKQALQMEREQIEEAFKQGGEWEELPKPRFNNYYTQTFKP